MKHNLQSIMHRVLAHRACVVNQNSLRIGQKTPPYPLRTLLVPIKLFFLLLALGLSVNVWGDGNPSFLGCTIDLTKGTESAIYNNGATAELGNVTALQWNNFSFRMTKYESEGKIGNLCGEAWCHYSLGLTSEEENWQDISQTNIIWNYNNNSNDVQYEGTINMDLVSGKPSGNYILKYCFYAHGNYYYNGDCSTSYWYPGNSGNYQITYTILPPKATNPSVTADGYFSGTGSSSDPWLVEVGSTLTLTGTATQEWTDANSELRISSNSDAKANYKTSLTFTSNEVTEKQEITIRWKYYNSEDNLISSSTSTSKKHYQFVQPRTVNFDAGTGSCSDESLTETTYGEGITLPTATLSDALTDAGWTFAGWAKDEITVGTSEAPELLAAGSTYTDITDGETLYAVYKKSPLVTDELTKSSFTDATAATQTQHTLSGENTASGTAYSAYIGANYGMNLNSTGPSGIISTSSVGHPVKVEVEWNTTTTNGRTIDVYGKNEAYTQNSDLYDKSATTKGTKIGSIVYGTSTVLDIPTEYNYIGLRSNANTLYVNKISITYSTGTTTYNSDPVAAVQYDLVFDLNGGTGTAPETQKHIQLDEITNFPSVADFVKTGFRCIGWNTTNSATTALTSYTMPGEAATLYAVWVPTYAITWIVEGNTIQTDLPINGEAINKPVTDPEPINNRVFVGWSSTPNAGHSDTDFSNFTSHTCTGTTETWYAVFATPEYEVTTELEDKGTYIITSQKGGKTVYLPNAAATGGDGPTLGTAIDVNGTKLSTIVTPDMLWTFNTIDGGWQIQSVAEPDKYLGTTSENGKNVRVNKSYDKAWTIADNTMKYNATNNYIGPKADEEYWYANNSLTSKTFASTTITFYTSSNTYRNYTTAPNTATYSVVYDLNGGEGTAVNQYELLTGASVTLAAAPSRFGYQFAGWNDGSQTYSAGANYTIASADVTLTAQWTILVPTSFTLASSNGYDLGTVTNNTTQMSVASWEPANLLESQKGVTWSIKSGDEGYLTVDENGLVTVIGCSANATVVATSIADPTITAEFTIHIYAPFCSGYSFRYGTEGQGDWNNCDPVCFTETDKDDGYSGKLFISDLFTIPNKPKFEVWWEDRREGWSEFADMTALPLHHLHSNRSIYKIEEGKGLGATGYLVIYGGYNEHNKFIDFMPDGYVLRLGSGENWTSVPFLANEDIWSTTWETDIVELTNNITSGNFYVGVKTAEDYVWLEGISNERNMTAMGKKSGKGENDWGSNISASDNGKHGKFRIYANSSDNNGNWFCHFVPYYQIAFNTGDGGSAVAPGYVSIEADSKSYTVTMSPETNPTRIGYQFAGWNDGSNTHTESWTINNISQDISLTAVWNKVNTLTFHYDGFTTDCDDVWSVATGEEITLPDGKVVAGKTFNGWSDGNTTYNAGATYTMPANDVILTATYTNWTIILNYNGTPTDPIEVPETGVVLPTEAQGEGAVNNIFIGFTKTRLDEAVTDLPDDFIAAGETYLPAENNETLFALYRQGDAEYQLIKDIKDLRLGAHVVLASIDEDYAMGNTFIEGQDTLPAITVTKDDDVETITFGNEVQEWVLDASDSKDHVGEWSFKKGSNTQYLAAPSGGKDKLSIANSKTASACFTLAIDASGRVTAKSVVATSTTTHNTLSMGENGFFACYNPNTIDAPDLAIYQHIGTKYVTSPTAVYRLKSVDMINGRLDGNDYYAENETVKPQGYANDGYSTSNTYRYYKEDTREQIGELQLFTMPAYNVVDSLNNRILQEKLTFVVPECVTQPATATVDGNTVDYPLPVVANVNAWTFAGWTKTEVTDTVEVRPEIFTTYITPHLKKDSAETFYAIYSYDGLETDGFVLSTVNNETTYYLGSYVHVAGQTDYYFSATTDKSQALTLYLDENKLYYLDGEAKKYLRAHYSSSSYSIRIEEETNKASASDWTITTNDNGTTTLSCTVNDQTRKLQLYNNSRYSIYNYTNDPVKEKALSYTTNPVCDEYIHYFVSDAEDADPEFSYKLGDNRKAAQYYPNNDCPNKRFIGWSTTPVTELVQVEPTLVNIASETFDHTQNFYAVYAAENGGKITSEYDRNIIETPSEMFLIDDMTKEYSGKNMSFVVENVIRTLDGNTFQTSTKTDAPATITTDRKIYDLHEVEVNFNKSDKKVTLKIQISENGELWENKGSIATNISSQTLTATLDNYGDYYVRIQASSEAQTAYKAEISSIIFKCANRYWLSDYSTNCTTASSAMIRFKNEDQTDAHETITAETIGEVITLPTPKMEGKHFDYWIINEVQYAAGDEYKLSHDVTATASWSDPQLVCTPETLYVVSAKGKTVRSSQTIHISCPEITEGTLATPVDIEKENGKLHFILENATATEDGLNATLAVEYTPKTATNMAAQEVTLTIGSISTKVKVRGICLPDQFVIAHQGSDEKWYALPADITAFGTYKGYEITLDESNNATAPQSAVYHLGAVTDDNGHIRLTPTDTTALQTSASTSVSAKTKIKVGKISDDTDNRSLWTLLTTDNSSFTFVNTAANNSLKFNNENKFGMYTAGTNTDTLFRIFKVTTSTITIPITVTNWTENGFSFTTTETIPTYDGFRLLVNEDEAETASCTPTFELYNVTSSTNFGTQQLIQLQWYKDNKLVASGSVVTPARASGEVTLSSLLTEDIDAKSLDIVVTSGTLTVNENVTIHNLDIRSGAAVEITGCTLNINQLIFHGGITDDETATSYDVPSLHIASDASLLTKLKTVYYYLDLNSSNYAPLALPFRATMASVRFTSRPTVDASTQIGKGFDIATYDGEQRAAQSETTTKYWKALKNGDWIEPSTGYIVTAKKLKGESHASLRFSMNSVDNAWTTSGEQGRITLKRESKSDTTMIKDTVRVFAWGVGQEGVAKVNMAWNFIANPYMSAIKSFNNEFMYITVPTNTVDGYEQIAMDDNDASIRPFYGVFVQAGETKCVTILRAQPTSAPAYLLAEEKPEQRAYINLEGASLHDRFGLIVGPRHSDDYEFNADLSKELGTANDLRAWLMSGDMKMAYLAVDDETARTLIPLNLRTPAESEYTFSLRESSRVDDLESLFLYDFETGTITNLLNGDYTFSAPAGAVENRFALNAVRAAKAPTELGGGTTGDRRQDTGQPPHKRLIDGNVYIFVNGALYNAEGKEVTK